MPIALLKGQSNTQIAAPLTRVRHFKEASFSNVNNQDGGQGAEKWQFYPG